MKEYLVEILDGVQTNYIYAFVIAESKKQARNKVYSERETLKLVSEMTANILTTILLKLAI